MKNERISRINDEIQSETANIIRGELNDPRLGSVVSVVKVETARDLSVCKIFISALGGADERKNALAGVKSASGLIRKLLAERLNLRVTPKLEFLEDDSIENGIRLSRLIDEVNGIG